MKNTMPKKKTTYRKKTRELLMRLVFLLETSGKFEIGKIVGTESDIIEYKDEYIKDTQVYIGDVNLDGILFDENDADARPDMVYFNEVFTALCGGLAKIDDAISRASIKWSMKRMGMVDLAILRVAVAEILFVQGVSDSVAVNEAVVLAKKYGTDEKTSGFVNGVLGKIINYKETI